MRSPATSRSTIASTRAQCLAAVADKPAFGGTRAARSGLQRSRRAVEVGLYPPPSVASVAPHRIVIVDRAPGRPSPRIALAEGVLVGAQLYD